MNMAHKMQIVYWKTLNTKRGFNLQFRRQKLWNVKSA